VSESAKEEITIGKEETAWRNEEKENRSRTEAKRKRNFSPKCACACVSESAKEEITIGKQKTEWKNEEKWNRARTQANTSRKFSQKWRLTWVSENVKLRNDSRLLNKNSLFLCLTVTYSLRCRKIEIFGTAKDVRQFFFRGNLEFQK
jgi:hypothetical protein